jgi:ubiquinone/menaquinone biosynthesis C-methylase UbiE
MSTICKICGSEEKKHIGSPVIHKDFPKAKNNYKIVQCKQCKFYYVLPEIDLTQKEWQELYENNYFEHSNITNWQKKIHEKEREMRLSLMKSKMKISNERFLDMGCGEGYTLKLAGSRGFEPYGVDIANNLTPENAAFNFFQGNIFEAKFPDNYFSAIYMDSVLEHVTNPMETLKELKRILKPGGAFFLIVPNEDSLINSFTRFMYFVTCRYKKYSKIKPFVNPYHIQGFNPISLKTALKKTGFSDIEIKGFGGNYMFWKAHRFGTLQYFWHLFIYPVGLLSILTKNQIQIMGMAVK